MDALDILTLVQPFGVTGCVIGDVQDVQTWAFQGADGLPAADDIAALARHALTAALVVKPAPDPLALLSARVDTLEMTVDTVTAQVQTLDANVVTATAAPAGAI